MSVANAQPVVCRVDLVPARVTLTTPDEAPKVLDGLRVIVTADRIYLFRDTNEGPTQVYSGRIETFDGRNTIGYQVTTASGDTVHFIRGKGCNCGSQLRSFRPFPQGLVQGPYNLT